MEKHPIQSLMSTTMENIKDMVDVNTVVGDPVMTNDGTTIIPISRVSFGFLSGGGEYNTSTWNSNGNTYVDGSGNTARSSMGSDELPFAGGTGAGVSVHPMGFLVVGNGQIKMLPTNYATPVDRVMELLPQVIGEIKEVFNDDGAPVSQSVSNVAKIPVETSKPVFAEPYLASTADPVYENKHMNVEKSGRSDKNDKKWDNNHSSK